jgi:hypothetical protein
VQKVINECSEMNPPEPIRLDFFVYTIPRLINDSSKIKNSVARANVFKRIFELGYKNSEFDNTIESSLRKFIGGQKLSGVAGKIDRLGKKYSWNAFYDYAGFLLLNKKLNTYDKYNSGKKYYERLSDVDIDICLPSKDYKQSLKLYNGNLFEGREVDTDWVNRNHIDSIKELFDTKINDGNYTMLYGLVEENLNKKFKTRSFIMVETFFISKTKYLEHLDISNIVFDWNKDVHIDNDSVYGVYFGELYWADTMPDLTKYNVGIPTGKTITIERELSIREVVRMEGSDNDIGKIITEEVDERFLFEAEPTLLRYGWETNSKTLDGFAEYFPSSNMGKYLNLKADPSSTQILDKDLKVAFSCITFKDDDNFENSFNYMRKDLLKEYMEANNLALVYQVKQHTYTENSNHNRIMKFFIY